MERYARQIAFDKIGKKGQKKIFESAVAIVGIGALGSVCAELLTRAGAGKLQLIDRDLIELSNLQSQGLFTIEDVGHAKAVKAKERLLKINHDVRITAIVADLDHRNVAELIKGDVVIACTDNLESRFLLNDYCKKSSIPLICGGVIAERGYVYTVQEKRPCLRCIFMDAATWETCTNVGVLNMVSHVIASLQANQAIKLILGKRSDKSLLQINLWKHEFMRLQVTARAACPACAGRYEYLTGEKMSRTVRICNSNTFQIKGKQVDLKELKSVLSKDNEIMDRGYCLMLKNLVIFEDGRALVTAENETQARNIYAHFIGN